MDEDHRGKSAASCFDVMIVDGSIVGDLDLSPVDREDQACSNVDNFYTQNICNHRLCSTSHERNIDVTIGSPAVCGRINIAAGSR